MNFQIRGTSVALFEFFLHRLTTWFVVRALLSRGNAVVCKEKRMLGFMFNGCVLNNQSKNYLLYVCGVVCSCVFLVPPSC